MNAFEAVNLYCERLGPGPYAEPLNALSNLAFFFWAWRLWQVRSGQAPLRAMRVLAALIALVGAGSLSFHVFATLWASVLDVLFIAIFNVSYLVLFLRSLAHWPWSRALAAGAGFVLLDRVVAHFIPADRFNGSGLYLPALAVLVMLIAYAWHLAPVAARAMTMAAAVFGVSLLARTVDQALCGVWPWGTHFLWHLLNAWVLYRLGRAIAQPCAADPPDAQRTC